MCTTVLAVPGLNNTLNCKLLQALTDHAKIQESQAHNRNKPTKSEKTSKWWWIGRRGCRGQSAGGGGGPGGVIVGLPVGNPRYGGER